MKIKYINTVMVESFKDEVWIRVGRSQKFGPPDWEDYLVMSKSVSKELIQALLDAFDED